MKVLLIGGGGREHALATSIAMSPLLDTLYVAPGNAGTAAHNVPLDITSNLAVVDFCQQNAVDLVVVGPEAPLVAGLSDDLNLAGVACFGPSAAAAQLEGSKSFARSFAGRHHIPSPRFRSFTEVEPAVEWLGEIGEPVVVKADGLAAGKGVVVPEDMVEAERAVFDMLAERSMGSAGDMIVVEERLIGEELSLFGIADGSTVIPLVTAQDHKRVGEGNTGPNTGGMGAFAPVPGVTPGVEAELTKLFLEPVVRGMAEEGSPYVGVIYAGIMMTEAGPRLVEYNCRFGDPEAQVIVPLIESDLLEIMWAATQGTLDEMSVELKHNTTAVAVVVAAKGYPGKPRKRIVVPEVRPVAGADVFLAAAEFDESGVLVSTGGRVVNVVGTADDLAGALENAYGLVDQLVAEADGLFARSDIGWKHAPRAKPGSAYADAGVSLDAAAAATRRITASVQATHDERVLAGLGSFGGVFDVSSLAEYDTPLLVATTDGVGTKTMLATEMNQWSNCGADIVNHCVNDILVQGARPLFFLDTIASARLDVEVLGQIVDGMSQACRAADCVLLGGETAEMPDLLSTGSVDVSGTMVGVVERANLLPTDGIAPGHVLVGLRSSGLHTNGYSLARKVFSGMDLTEPMPGGKGETIAESLLAVHRSYLPVLSAALKAGLVDGLAHITGGGFIDNIPRVLPEGCGAAIDVAAWPRPVLFNYLIARAGLSELDAHQVLNCGIGMVALVAPDLVDDFQDAVPEETWIVGEVTIGGGVELR